VPDGGMISSDDEDDDEERQHPDVESFDSRDKEMQVRLLKINHQQPELDQHTQLTLTPHPIQSPHQHD
jgi:hypothetical protein